MTAHDPERAPEGEVARIARCVGLSRRADDVARRVLMGQSATVRLGHDDLADRFLVATALVHDLTLATADRKLLKRRHVATLPS